MAFTGLNMLHGSGHRAGHRAEQSQLWQALYVWLKEKSKFLMAGLALMVVVFLISPAGTKTIEGIKTFATNAAFANMTLEQVHFVGFSRTQNQQLNDVIALSQGSAMLQLNLENIKAQVEQLPWVKTAAVNRQFPDSLYVNIIEREPFALWQIDGEIWLIDGFGTKITQDNLASFATLPFIIGSGAPESYAKMAEVLASEPVLNAKVASIIRVGDRRWDVMFATGARLRLPEESEKYSTGSAWERFAKMERDHDLLAREVAVYDMRLSDRIIVTLTERGERAPLALGDET
ncbi:MAG: FtsQ-type POTRA domain-containing protein [Sphingomonadales bacterium]|nr:FtsQ-type POTRA domain-containing protein [Sphingomonadales bacterium]